MSTGNPHPDPEDIFAETRMSFGDHLEDLRSHLWRAIYGFGIAMVLSLFIGKPVLEFIASPVVEQLERFYDRRIEKVLAEIDKDPALKKVNQPTHFFEVAAPRSQVEALVQMKPGDPAPRFEQPRLKEREEARTGEEAGWFNKLMGGGKKPDPGVGEGPLVSRDDLITLWITYLQPVRYQALMSEAQRLVGRRPALSTLSIQEAFMVYFKVSMVCGLVIGSPWIFYQIWAFVAAGLYPHERRYVRVYLPFSLGLFLVGVFMCQFFVIPRAIEALLWFNEWIGLEPDLRLNEWLGFAILMPLVFGVSFQTPLVMLFLERIGVMDVEGYQKKRRMAWFLMAIFAALITPSTDAISMLFLWVPMSLLFELGIYLCKLSPRQPDFGLETPDAEEMVEV